MKYVTWAFGQPLCGLVSLLQPHGIITRTIQGTLWKAFCVEANTRCTQAHQTPASSHNVYGVHYEWSLTQQWQHGPFHYESHGLCMLAKLLWFLFMAQWKTSPLAIGPGVMGSPTGDSEMDYSQLLGELLRKLHTGHN